ncbi:predicted protein [Chaetomium globosum CBS 148.51]|uniref:Uncharacterized protein n=1 Tax=Chaetomium globosum (strain ATCC 6205 / CBS 148.51 / DSM 1962 / NBRC 6347 / NRRL 1970) TaxID=306901 RepID=Q2HC04_CHAGB|nr:uncharacterized protein CHGG_02250 [Chaetomium globosum CBS 148.51]EAQ90315.1 predicted protein [Chaetomium globosum CBS 148.51]
MAKYNNTTGQPLDSKKAASTENRFTSFSLSPRDQRRSRPMAHQIMPMAYSEHPHATPRMMSALRSQGAKAAPEVSAKGSERERFWPMVLVGCWKERQDEKRRGLRPATSDQHSLAQTIQTIRRNGDGRNGEKREGEQKGDLKEDGDHTILNRSCGPGREMMGFSGWESQTESG